MPKPEEHRRHLDEFKDEIMKLYVANMMTDCIPKATYETRMEELLCNVCDEMTVYSLCCRHGESRMRDEQFGRYKWNIKRCDGLETKIFKVLGDAYKLLDDDEYYWKPKEDMREY